MLCNQDSGYKVWKHRCSQDCCWTHSFDHTPKIRFALSVTRKQNVQWSSWRLSTQKVHIDIDPNAKPVHSRPYPVPQIHLKTFKTEFDHLVRIGVLAPQHESEWASPNSLHLKRVAEYAGSVTFTKYNKVTWCKLYPLLIITDKNELSDIKDAGICIDDVNAF